MQHPAKMQSHESGSLGSTPRLSAKQRYNMNFYIDEAYLTSVTIRTIRVEGKTDEERVLDRLKGTEQISISTIDHPEFTKLREQLGKDGYIYIERGWWNGDMVLKSFTLNGFKFKKSEAFACASALGISFQVRRKINAAR